MMVSNSYIELPTKVVLNLCKQALQSLAIITARTDKQYQDSIEECDKQIHERRKEYHMLPWYKRWVTEYPYSIDLQVKRNRTKEDRKSASEHYTAIYIALHDLQRATELKEDGTVFVSTTELGWLNYYIEIK